MMIFSGSSNKALAGKVAEKLRVSLGKVELTRFANREVRVYVKEKKIPAEVVVLQSLSNPPDEHLVEFCLICDALKRLGANRIVAVIPWLGYSKQDKVFRIGEPLSVKVIAEILQVVLLERIITFDLHNPSILGFFDVPVVNLSAQKLFLEHFRKMKASELVVVATDAGAVKGSTEFAHALGVDVAFVDKKRDLISGRVSIRGINGTVKNKDAVIVEDMIVTGSTLVEASRFLKKNGAGKIFVAATHHLFLPGVQEKLEECVDGLLITDTVARPAGVKFEKTQILSVAGMIGESLG